MGKFSFTVTHKNKTGQQRCGLLETPHGVIETPVFMPVGTRGTVKGILPAQLHDTGARIILANTYHLWQRPGAEVVAQLGGLQRFTGWGGPMLTDSGGYQVFSLSSLNRIGQDEVEFSSHIDGRKITLSPQIATQVQNKLGADIIMAFDECVALPCDTAKMAKAVERTIRWAQQSLDAHKRPDDQWMFGIVQGGTDYSLRQQCAEALVKLNFPGYAIGGLSVGESHEQMIDTVACTTGFLPENKPRYLMGVGMPRDIIAAVAKGVDMFDCVLPTRNGRNAGAFTRKGQIKLRNKKFTLDTGPLDDQCDCYTCRNFSRGYIRHLFLVKEMLGPILVALHNLSFFQWLMAQTRQAIREERFADWAAQWLK